MDDLAEAGPSTRRVRTVPPSAAFEPPSPSYLTLQQITNSPSQPNPPARPSNDSTLVSPVPVKRPRMKLRYSTSDSSDDEGDDSDDDDDPPWWTFTNRGMMKMRAKTLRRANGDVKHQADDSEVAVKEAIGEDTNLQEDSTNLERDKGKLRRGFHLRRTSSGHEGIPTQNSTHWNLRRRPESPGKNTPRPKLDPPIRMNTSNLLFRSRKETTAPVRIPMQRRYSAPSSPVAADNDDSQLPSMAGVIPPPKQSSTPPIRPISQSSSRINLSRLDAFHRAAFIAGVSRESESLTDSEAIRPKRLNGKRSQNAIPASAPNARVSRGHSDAESPQITPSGSQTPRNRRLTANRLMKINLPPPLTHHFSHGWPHAGSWQDALHGHYGDSPRGSSDLSRPPRKGSSEGGRRSSKEAGKRHSQQSAVFIDEARPRVLAEEPRPMTPPARRPKSKRKRYFEAMAPPTPSGLGFVPTERENDVAGSKSPQIPGTETWKEGRLVDEGFNWGDQEKAERGIRTEGSPADGNSQSRITDISSSFTDEKGQVKRIKRHDGMTRKQKWRRMLFLDARVTIYIRFINLAIVVVLLALAITTRLEMFRLRLPGLLGPSTTLMISYACITIVHAIVAVYREYFGRPIGLWGLRSKMLWVCLDLVLICLWSSALSLAINDLIATPLECVSTAPWWHNGLSTSYAELLDDLAEASEALTSSSAIALNTTISANLTDSADHRYTPVRLIAATLGIELPDEIIKSQLAREICRRQEGCIALVLLALMLYGGNMVLSLFRIFETISRTANVDRAVMI